MQSSKEIDVVVDKEVFSKHQEISIEVDVDGQKYRLEREVSNAKDDKMWPFYLIPALVSTIILYLTITNNTEGLVRLSGEASLGMYVTVYSFISNLIVLPIYLIRLKRSTHVNQIKYIYWRNIPTIVISFLIVQLIALLFTFWMFGQLFVGLYLEVSTATFLGFIILVVVNYFGIYFVNSISVRNMISFLMAFLFIGFFVAMATNADSQWWHHHISYLGSYAANRGWQFNLTLVLTSLIMIVLVDYLFVIIRPYFPEHKGLRILYFMLIVIAICIAGIGVFRSDAAGRIKYYHSYVIYVIMILVACIIIFARKLIPRVTDNFLRMSYGAGGLMVVLTILYVSGQLSLILYELSGVPLALIWLMSLFDTLIALTEIEANFKINILKE